MNNQHTSQNTGWNFDNSYVQLPKILFSSQKPTPVQAPELVILNGTLAKKLGLDLKALQNGVDVFAGNQLPEGATPIAQAYAGHQFAHFTMLGDGRAILLGEQITPEGNRYDIGLKGSGRTPYSRGGDGRAALGPMLREYIISEAMYALGIPTSRSLAVVTTGEPVFRETALPGAILTRVASSHLRVGTFQFVANWGSKEDLQRLADYAIKRHYPDIERNENQYVTFLNEVIKRQASLIAKWQLVGFIHGVMNTDNMTISGESIDYGPCAFMDTYDHSTVFSSIDRMGRYAYGKQPQIGGWNLTRLAEALLPLLDESQEKAIEKAEKAISRYSELFTENWLSGMRAKLGLFDEEKEDELLINELLSMMQNHRADFTNTFRSLSMDQLDGMFLFKTQEFNQWYNRWQERRSRQRESNEASYDLMKKNNPAVIPRNHRVEEALHAAVEEGDLNVLGHLLEVLSKPFAYSKEQEEYCQLPVPSNQNYQTFCGT